MKDNAATESVLEEMCRLAMAAREQAYAPYSRHPVGAVLRSADGRLFSGCNVENAAYPLGQCAEASAIGALIVAGAREITDIVVVGPAQKLCTPCGGCRQKLWEFGANATVHLCVDGRIAQKIALAELLPAAFGPHNIPQEASP